MGARSNQMNGRDKLYLEFMRIIATYFVIFNHTGDNGFFLFSKYPTGSLQWGGYLFISVFCKFSVPLFFAISGALLIHKTETLRVLFQKRVLRIAAGLLIFSFLYYLEGVLSDPNRGFSLREFLSTLAASDWNYSYWYLYAFLAFLISLPFLRALCQNLESKYYLYMIFLAIFYSGLLPIILYRVWQGKQGVNGSLYIGWVTSNIVIYPCVGYFLEKRYEMKHLNRKKILWIWMLTIGLLALSCYMTTYKAEVTGECYEAVSQDFHSSFVLIHMAALYLTVKWIFTKLTLPDAVRKLISVIGANTFGIYLVHIYLMNKMNQIGLWDFLRVKFDLNYMLSAFLYCALVFMIALPVSMGMRKLPLFRLLM